MAKVEPTQTAPVDGKEATVEDEEERSSALAQWIGQQVQRPLSKLILVVVLCALTIAAAYWTIMVLYPGLWGWAENSLLRQTVAIFASIFLLYVPGLPAYMLFDISSALIEPKVALDPKAAAEQVRETEQDVIDRLEKTDRAGLLPLLRYSRAQLEQYYEMGLGQTRRSFFHALVAMWLGFTLLVLGLALYVGAFDRLGIQRPSLDFNLLILATATIIEFISVMFLWVYRSTMGQLTFYYRLQVRNHTSILCYRMTMDMTSGKDGARRAIVNSMLDNALTPERPPVEGSEGLRRWVTKRGAGDGAEAPADAG